MIQLQNCSLTTITYTHYEFVTLGVMHSIRRQHQFHCVSLICVYYIGHKHEHFYTQELPTFPENTGSLPAISGVHVAQPLVLCIVFCCFIFTHRLEWSDVFTHRLEWRDVLTHRLEWS